jgi:hypothetical protein
MAGDSEDKTMSSCVGKLVVVWSSPRYEISIIFEKSGNE